jgi:hypothetical protein
VHRFPRPSPALFISLLALFFALGGTAFAIGQKSTPQARCQTGAIRGIALVTGGEVGMDSLPSTYQSDDGLFSYRWSCTGGQVVVRKPVDKNGVDVQFVGNPASVAIIQSVANGVPYAGSVTRNSDGSFFISMGGSNVGQPGPWQFQWDVPFTIVVM